MYQEVAVDPKCLSEYHYYGLLKERFGFEAGRYVIAPVREWAREAFIAAKNSKELQPVKKKSIINFLNKLQKSKDQDRFALPIHRSEINVENWTDWCTKQTEYLPFNSILSEQFEGAIGYVDIIERHASWHLPPTVTINRTSQEISACIAPIVRYGGNLTIVDQYFCFAPNPVLHNIFLMLQQYQSIRSITLVTAIDVAQPEVVFKRDYVDNFKLLPNFSLVIAPEKFFHDRYLMTEYCGIKSGHGFSPGAIQGAQADKLSISLCSKHECEETHQWIEAIVTDGRARKLRLTEK